MGTHLLYPMSMSCISSVLHVVTTYFLPGTTNSRCMASLIKELVGARPFIQGHGLITFGRWARFESLLVYLIPCLWAVISMHFEAVCTSSLILLLLTLLADNN